MISKALEAPLIVLNSFGFSGAETLATYLSAHDEIGLLPGQNFIQQNHTLYRPITLTIDDAKACFDLLATKQYTKTGIQWAGLGKFMSPEYSARYSLDKHRAGFIEEYTNLPNDKRSSFTHVVKLYTQCFFQTMGESLSGLSYYGVYGSNFILNAPAYPNFHQDTRILQVKPSPAQWLSLASQARTWNPENALCFYIIQNLCIAQCERKQKNILSISYTELIKNTQNTLEQCCDFLDISPCTASTVVAGLGHAPATQAFFDKIFLDASDIERIYSGSNWFETANGFNDWCDSFLNDANAVSLLEKYQTYWNSTSHIAFDWIGPLEKQLKQLISYHANEFSNKSTIKPPCVAYQFYQQWYKSNSINHAKVVGDACYPLGAIESEIPLPKLQYFMRIAISYIQSSVELQGEKLHSYHPAREGHLYKQLCKPQFQQSIDRNGLTEAFATMEATIDKTESLFDELRRTGLLNAGMLTGSNNFNSPSAGISEDEIKAIAVSGPDITEHENTFVARAMSDWYSKPYFYCEEFEQRFAQYHNREFGLMTPSCTTANHLLLMGLGIGPGDEVLVPECTWIASASPVYYTGATPIYCDIDADDWCISLRSMKDNLTANTRAIVAVNIYGNMAKMDELERFARDNDLYLIEDAAESVGSAYKGRKSGEFGVGSVFSFHRTKTMTTGEGGMLLIDDEALFKRCAKLRDHGRGPDTPAFTHEIVAYKYMPFNVQAALGLAQFERLDELVAKKRHILAFYKQRLGTYDGIQFNLESEDVYNSAWCSTIVLGSEYSLDKPSLIDALKSEGIPSRPFFYPLSSQPGIRSKVGNNIDYSLKNPTSYKLSSRGINLPSALNLSDRQLDYVCNVLEKLLNSNFAQTRKITNKAA